MKESKLRQSFFRSTRGRIVGLLRHGADTVEELSRDLGLTDNAVRAHLEGLMREGLVERRGIRPGLRKPHFSYALTGEAEDLFPKAYPTLLNRLLTVLKKHLSSEDMKKILRETAASLVPPGRTKPTDFESRGRRIVETLEALGGAATAQVDGDRLTVTSHGSCPFAAAVAEHPEVCFFAEALLSEVAGTEVREHCRKGANPLCAFEIVSA